MNNISNRCISILNLLLQQQESITAQQLADKLGVSIRTIRYDFEQIIQWAYENKIEIEAIQKKGISLTEDAKKKIVEKLKGNDNSDYFLSGEERSTLIVARLLCEDVEETIDQLAEQYGVSRNTILRDVDKVESWFNEHNVHLLRKQKRGIGLKVSETIRRKLMVEYLLQKENVETVITRYTANQVGDSLHNNDRNVLYALVKQNVNLNLIIDDLIIFLRKNGFSISDWDFINLVLFYSIQKMRINQGYLVSDVVSTKEKRDQLMLSCLKQSDLCYAELNDKEMDYIVSIFSAYINFEMEENDAENTILANEIYLFIVEKVKAYKGYDLSNDVDFKRSLFLHLAAMIKRIRMNIPYSNVLINEIKQSQKEIYELTNQIFDEITEKFNIEKNESEVGFITLYINLAISKKQTIKTKLYTKVVLVCAQGVATSSFLARAIQSEFNYLQIVDKISAIKAVDYDYSNIDLILTTIDLPIKTLKPCIKVKPMLSRIDIARIDRFLSSDNRNDEKTKDKVNEIIKIVKKNCIVENEDNLKKELLNIFIEKQDNNSLPSLLEVLKKENIICHIEAFDWDDAVVQTCEPLINNNAITDSYLNEIFDIKNNYNQYSLIANGICMPHASANMNNKLAMSLATLKNPIEIKPDDLEKPVKIYAIFVLAINDLTKCAKALDEIFNIFNNNPNFAEVLHQASSARELADIMSEYYDRIKL